MGYRELGNTGRTVSRIGFGGAVAGLKNHLHEYDPSSDESIRGAVEATERALEPGISYFDTAPGYGDGQSKKMFGMALEGVKPEPTFLATKVSLGTRGEVMRSVENSLKNLKWDNVDLLQIYGDNISRERHDSILGPGGMLGVARELKAFGMVKYLGLTTEDSNDVVYEPIGDGESDVAQTCYNFLPQHPYEPSRPSGSMIETERKGMGIVTMRASTSGTFQRQIRAVNPENTFNYSRALIQFVFSNPLVDVALIGMRGAARVMENVKICNDMTGRIDLDEAHKRYV